MKFKDCLNCKSLSISIIINLEEEQPTRQNSIFEKFTKKKIAKIKIDKIVEQDGDKQVFIRKNYNLREELTVEFKKKRPQTALPKYNRMVSIAQKF